MIIDVDADVRRRLFTKLLQFDVFSDCATNAREAIARFEDYVYGFVLLDIGLPDDGTAQVLHRINEIPLKERPIIVATTTSMERARGLDVELVQILLRRPLDIAHVAELIHSCSLQPLANSLPAAARHCRPHIGER